MLKIFVTLRDNYYTGLYPSKIWSKKTNWTRRTTTCYCYSE